MSFQEYLSEKANEDIGNEKDKDMGAIIDFFTTHKDPDDASIHKLAGELGYKEGEKKDVHQFEGMIYSILSSFLNAGRYKTNPVEPDEEELKKGIEVEKEHTTSETIARRIALDHLAEMPDYYTKLAKMEGK